MANNAFVFQAGSFADEEDGESAGQKNRATTCRNRVTSELSV